MHWRIDPDQVTGVPDVMVGLVEVCRVMVTPEQAIAFATPAYPPFIKEERAAGFPVLTVDLDSEGRS